MGDKLAAGESLLQLFPLPVSHTPTIEWWNWMNSQSLKEETATTSSEAAVPQASSHGESN